jgi:hypothetical protein
VVPVGLAVLQHPVVPAGQYLPEVLGGLADLQHPAVPAVQFRLERPEVLVGQFRLEHLAVPEVLCCR